MTKFLFNRKTTLLVSIGLVLVGLLGGILLMLTFGSSKTVVVTEGAEPVRMGQAKQSARPAVLSDSGASPEHVKTGPKLGRMNERFRTVAARIRPAVVFIRAQSGDGSDWLEALKDGDDQSFFKHHPPQQSVGSGVLISKDGYIVTNNHVVRQAGSISITLADKREYEAEVVGTDPSTDMAVIKVDGSNLPAAAFGNSDKVRVGDWVLAVGNPFRLTSTVTAGIVSALGRQVNIINDKFRIENFIQTDAAINPGNSGGALVNMKGELVGISTAIATEDGTNAGYGFAVPSNLMERVTKDLIRYGEVRRGYLGVEIRKIDARAAERLNLKKIGGVYLDDIRRGGAADRAGLRRGDVVLSVNGRSVNAPNELQSAIARYHPGDKLSLQVWRQGDRKQYEVTLMSKNAPVFQNWFSSDSNESTSPNKQEQPSPDAPSDKNVFKLNEWGMGLQPLTEKKKEAYEVDEGLYVAYVKKGGVAGRAGLPRGVVITAVAGKPVGSAGDVLKALEQADPQKTGGVLFRVRRRDGRVAFYEIETSS